jgi:hypothetical protein
MERVEEAVVGGEVEAEAVATAAGVERQEPREVRQSRPSQLSSRHQYTT